MIDAALLTTYMDRNMWVYNVVKCPVSLPGLLKFVVACKENTHTNHHKYKHKFNFSKIVLVGDFQQGRE